jgi:hypothetical protein
MAKEARTILNFTSKFHYSLAMLVAMLGFANRARAQTCIEPPPSLVHWWTCDDFNDHNDYPLPSGAPALPLVAYNGATIAPGLVGNACSFNTADYSNDSLFFIADDPSMNPADGSFTAEMWVNPSTQASFGHPFIRFGNPSSTAYNFYSITQSTGGFWLSYVGDGNQFVEIDGPVVEPNSWHHIALVIDRADTRVIADVSPSVAILYYDGAEVARRDISGIGTIDPIGYDARVGAEGYLGLVDEIALYSSALTPEQIASIFTANSAGKGKTDRDGDGCSDCRDSACNRSNLETSISYQGTFFLSPVYAARAAYRDLAMIKNDKLAVAVRSRFSSNDGATEILVSETFQLIGANTRHVDVEEAACQLCIDETGGKVAPQDICYVQHAATKDCSTCCYVALLGETQCAASMPFGLGCKEMTRAEMGAAFCVDPSSGAANIPWPACCPYPPNSSSSVGDRVFISDSLGCCIRAGGCKWDTSPDDGVADNIIGNGVYF